MVSLPQLGFVSGLAKLTAAAPREPSPVLAALFAAWRGHSPLARQCVERLGAHKHGDLPRWLRALGALPNLGAAAASFDAAVTVGSASDLSCVERQTLRAALKELAPWRKGPFRLFGVYVDAEWRCDRKWARVAPHVDLAGRRVLDVGCGNGYYGWRMLAAGAACVTGIDPSPLFALQHGAVCHYLGAEHRRSNVVLPLRLEEAPGAAAFDAVFSMGVIHHRRDPAAHVRLLATHARDDAPLVLESLVVDGTPIKPRERYARMRNVWVVPNVALLIAWARDAGFSRAEVVDVATTTTAEQRATEWMPHQSLAHALDPADAACTVEGYPAPRRAVIIARK